MAYNRLSIEKENYSGPVRKFLDSYVRTHWHDYYEIEYFIEGKGTYIVNGEKYEISKGMMAIITPVDFHSILSEKSLDKTPDIYHFSFEESFIDYDYISLLANLNKKVIYFDDNIEKIESLFSHMHICNDIYKDYTCKNLISEIILEFARKSNEDNVDFIGNKKQKTAEYNRMQLALSYIQLHFTEDITIESISNQISVSTSYFSHVFPKYTGTTFKKYIINLRFNLAVKMIKYSEFSITEICFSCGFNSLNNMSRVFKEKIGLSPSEYRRKLAESKV